MYIIQFLYYSLNYRIILPPDFDSLKIKALKTVQTVEMIG